MAERARSRPPSHTSAATAGQTDFDYLAQAERHLVPPKASQLQCETHGAFDDLWSNPADIKTAYAIAAREAGTLYDPLPGAQATRPVAQPP